MRARNIHRLSTLKAASALRIRGVWIGDSQKRFFAFFPNRLSAIHRGLNPAPALAKPLDRRGRSGAIQGYPGGGGRMRFSQAVDRFIADNAADHAAQGRVMPLSSAPLYRGNRTPKNVDRNIHLLGLRASHTVEASRSLIRGGAESAGHGALRGCGGAA